MLANVPDAEGFTAPVLHARVGSDDALPAGVGLQHGLAGVDRVPRQLVRLDVDPVVGGLLELDVLVLPRILRPRLGEGVAARSQLPSNRLLGRVVVSCANLLRPLHFKVSDLLTGRQHGVLEVSALVVPVRALGLGFAVDVLGVGEVFVGVEVIPAKGAVGDRRQGSLVRIFGGGVGRGLRGLGLRPKVGYGLAFVATDHTGRTGEVSGLEELVQNFLVRRFLRGLRADPRRLGAGAAFTGNSSPGRLDRLHLVGGEGARDLGQDRGSLLRRGLRVGYDVRSQLRDRGLAHPTAGGQAGPLFGGEPRSPGSRYALSSLPTPLGVLTLVLLLEQGCSGFQRGRRLCLELGFQGRGGLTGLTEQGVDVLNPLLLGLNVPLNLLNTVRRRQ